MIEILLISVIILMGLLIGFVLYNTWLNQKDLDQGKDLNGELQGIHETAIEQLKNIEQQVMDDVKTLGSSTEDQLRAASEKMRQSTTEFMSTMHLIDKDITSKMKKLPKDTLKSIQGGISPRKGKVGEIMAYMKLMADYDRLIMISNVVDFIGISDESIDFIEIKSNTSRLSKDQKTVKKLILDGKVRWIESKVTFDIITEKEVFEDDIHD